MITVHQGKPPLRSSILWILGCILFIMALGNRWYVVPALMYLLDPVDGVWANAESGLPQGKEIINAEHLSEPVEIWYDQYYVPHIYAQNLPDLFFAQGYVAARDRLWQMDTQARSAMGRLSEVIGELTLNIDLFQRRLGMRESAENSWNYAQKDPLSKMIFSAYSEGVNAYIKTLSHQDMPVEFKLLEYTPELWNPIKSNALIKLMAQTLTLYNNDVGQSNSLGYFQEPFITQYIDLVSSIQSPIISKKTWDIKPKIPSPPDTLFIPKKNHLIVPYTPNPNNGSNNWALNARKTKEGYPILANDPHLGLTFPAIWYQMHLQTPNFNAYGVTIPGLPLIIIGFNEHLAWGMTNTGTDVMDWYELVFRDDKKEEYLFDGKWLPVKKRLEHINIRGGKTVIDTIKLTHFGPIAPSVKTFSDYIPVDHALRWIANDPSNDLPTFYKLNVAKTYKDYLNALSHLHSPSQNIALATVTDTIAMHISGDFPIKWQGQGKFIGDGTNPIYQWHGWIPEEEQPQEYNPERGFVSSANQISVSKSYPYYLNNRFGDNSRGARINDILSQDRKFNVQDMINLQNDNYSYHAVRILPMMLKTFTDTKQLNDMEKAALMLLQDWKYYNHGKQVAPSIFHTWWSHLKDEIWDDEIIQAGIPLALPTDDQLIEILLNKINKFIYIDNIETPKKETLPILLSKSFHSAIKSLEETWGNNINTWQWEKVKRSRIPHMLRIPGFGQDPQYTSGGRESINAMSRSHGPSWRMVVHLKTPIEAYGIYPGGQSGNIGSFLYNDGVDEWAEGKLRPLLFFSGKFPKTPHYTIILSNK